MHARQNNNKCTQMWPAACGDIKIHLFYQQNTFIVLHITSAEQMHTENIN